MSTSNQLLEGLKSCIRVAVATSINPIAGGAALLIEVGRSAMTAVADEEGTQAGKIIGFATGDFSDIDDTDDE